MTLETRTVALTAEQWRYLGMSLEDQAQAAEIFALTCELKNEPSAAAAFYGDVALWNTILTAIRSAAP